MEPFILSKHIVSVIPDFLCHLSNVPSFYMYDHHLFPVILAKARSQRAVLFQPRWSQRKHFANVLLILGIHLQFLLCIFTHVHGYLFFCRVKVVGRRSGLSCDQPWRASKRQPVVRNGTNNNQAMSSLKCWLKLGKKECHVNGGLWDLALWFPWSKSSISKLHSTSTDFLTCDQALF